MVVLLLSSLIILVWAFIVRKVTVNVAWTVYVCATSAVVVAPFVGHHHHG